MLHRYQALFASLQAHEVRYVMIGAMAGVTHGLARLTLDADLLIDPTPENSTRLLAALADAGFGTAHDITPEELLRNEIVMFRDRVLLDVQTRTPGLSFSEAWAHKESRDINGTPFWVASLEDLIASKTAAGRPKDLEDVAVLKALAAAKK